MPSVLHPPPARGSSSAMWTRDLRPTPCQQGVPMQPNCLVRAHRFLAVLLLVALASLSAFAGDANPEADRNALALGTVTVLGPATCLSGSTKGSACTSINVSCPGVTDLTAQLSEAFPTGAAMGTIILNSGGDG